PFLNRMKGGEHCFDRLRFSEQADRDFRDNGERPLRPNDCAYEIHSDHFASGIAKTDDFTFSGYGLDRQDMIGRHSILQAMRSSRILRDVSADTARHLTRRIRRVVQAVWS